MANAERALERLYEASDVRDELRDPEAQSLLKWAEAQVTRLAQESADDAEFDAKFKTLRGMLKDMNRFVGKRAELDTDAQTAKLSEISAAAQALGAPASVSAQAAADWKTLDDSAALTTLLNSVALPTDETVSAQAHAVEAAKPEAVESPAQAHTVGEGQAPPAEPEPDSMSTQADEPPPPSAPPLGGAPSAGESSAKSPVGSGTPNTTEGERAIIPAEDKPKDLAQKIPGNTPLYTMPPKETETNDEAQDNP
jgi:hypothetical protein